MTELQSIPFTRDVAALLSRLPAVAGVAQVQGPEGQSLMIGAPSNLRRWAAAELGAGPPPAKGKRPRTDLSPIATAVAFATTTSAFHQRLTYERLMARYVPVEKRRDLKPPVFLHVDPAERFPRLTLRRAEDGLDGSYGPFRDRRSAEKARSGLHKLIPLRPCDYVFEPHPALPLGLSCLFAQVRSCAAPCLERTTEAAYRDLARAAAALLANPHRPADGAEAWIAPVVTTATGRGVVVARGSAGAELYPVLAGTVLEEDRVVLGEGGLDAAAASLRWDAAGPARSDWPWFAAWLTSPRRRDAYVALPGDGDHAQTAAALRACLEPASATG